jgi:hypothetical protein
VVLLVFQDLLEYIELIYAQTGFDKLRDRRDGSLLKFITSVVNNTTHSRISQHCVRPRSEYALRTNFYNVPMYTTSIGKQRVAIKALTLLNCSI